MSLLDRYIGRVIALGTLAAMLVLMSLLGVLELANELNDVGKGDYTVANALVFVILIMPRFAYELYPVGVLLGSLSGLGILAARSEFVAMRAAGMSVARIVVSVMKSGVLMMLFVIIVIGEMLAPVSEQHAQRLRADAISDQISLHTRYGFWARDGQAYVNIRTVLSQTALTDLYIYDYNDDMTLRKATHARFARYDKDHWLLKDIKQNDFTPEGVTSSQISQAKWTSLIEPNLLQVLVVKPNVLPLWGLHRYIEFLRDNGQDATAYEVAFWGKLASPLVTLVMLFLSIPFVFGSLRSITIGQRTFLGSMVGIGFFLLNKAASHVAVVYDFNPLLAASLPGLLLMVMAFLMMRRVY